MYYFGSNQLSNDDLGNNTATVAHTASSVSPIPLFCAFGPAKQTVIRDMCVTLCLPILLSDSVHALFFFLSSIHLCKKSFWHTYRYPSFLSATACMGAFQGQKYEKEKKKERKHLP